MGNGSAIRTALDWYSHYFFWVLVKEVCSVFTYENLCVLVMEFETGEKPFLLCLEVSLDV